MLFFFSASTCSVKYHHSLHKTLLNPFCLEWYCFLSKQYDITKSCPYFVLWTNLVMTMSETVLRDSVENLVKVVIKASNLSFFGLPLQTKCCWAKLRHMSISKFQSFTLPLKYPWHLILVTWHSEHCLNWCGSVFLLNIQIDVIKYPILLLIPSSISIPREQQEPINSPRSAHLSNIKPVSKCAQRKENRNKSTKGKNE